MVTISFLKCDFCYTCTNALAVASLIAYDGGFVYNIFRLTVSV